MQIIIEILALVALLLLSLFLVKFSKTPARICPRQVLAALRRPALVFLLVGFLAFAASALTAVVYGIPQPRIHDEFSYLLEADTFAQARLTNPPHPLWQHFESFHIIGQPTYASKYPPAQGLMLALGQVVVGHPIAGVWLSVGLAAAAICWMLAGWVPLRWAWIGGLLAVVRLVFSGALNFKGLDTFGYWSQTYWGGAVAALGGALVFGALPRILKKPRPRDALWLALGLVILANSRPFEGLVVCLPAAAVLGVWLFKTRSGDWRSRGRRVVLPATLVLLLGALWMGYYNFRVTGNPFLMPYQVYEAAYAVTPFFLWQPLKPAPPYNHQPMMEFNVIWSAACHQEQQSLADWLMACKWKVQNLWMFYFGILFAPFMAALPWTWHRFRVKFALAVWGLLILAFMTATWASPHYAAPAFSLAILLMVECLRQVRLATWRGRRVGPALAAAALPVLLVTPIVIFVVAQHLNPTDWHLDRARILQNLENDAGRHLVLVRYSPGHSPHEQWIYNRADLDGAKVVWAWEMGPEADRELLDYFKDRRVWLLNADVLPRRLVAYPETQATQ